MNILESYARVAKCNYFMLLFILAFYYLPNSFLCYLPAFLNKQFSSPGDHFEFCNVLRGILWSYWKRHCYHSLSHHHLDVSSCLKHFIPSMTNSVLKWTIWNLFCSLESTCTFFTALFCIRKLSSSSNMYAIYLQKIAFLISNIVPLVIM